MITVSRYNTNSGMLKIALGRTLLQGPVDSHTLNKQTTNSIKKHTRTHTHTRAHTQTTKQALFAIQFQPDLVAEADEQLRRVRVRGGGDGGDGGDGGNVVVIGIHIRAARFYKQRHPELSKSIGHDDSVFLTWA